MTNYRKGSAFEFRVRNFFRKLGYTAERKAASSPYDIIVIKDGVVKFLIDAKKTSQKNKKFIYIKEDDIKKIIKESDKLNTIPLIIYGFYRSPIFVEPARELIKKDVARVDGRVKLIDYLKNQPE